MQAGSHDGDRSGQERGVTEGKPMNRIELSGKSQGKGRNGYFLSLEDATKLAQFLGEAIETKPTMANIEH
jgi:hypothetical protein